MPLFDRSEDLDPTNDPVIPLPEPTFREGDRVSVRLCAAPRNYNGTGICGRPAGCMSEEGPRAACRVLAVEGEPFHDLHIEITHSPEYPSRVGETAYVRQTRVTHLD